MKSAYLYILFIIMFSGLSCSAERKDYLYILNENLDAAAESAFLFTKTDFFYSYSERNRIPHRIVSLIESSRERIDLWVYGFNDPRIIRALERARDRGVSIHITGDPGTDYSILNRAGFYPSIRAKTGIQHAKVIIIDESFLISGTGNFTVSDMHHNENLFFFMNIGKKTGREVRKALLSEKDTDPFLSLPWGITMFLSPEHGRLIQQIITEEILKARYRIRYMIFSHTDPVITAALMLAVRKGITVEGIYDDPSGNARVQEDTPPEHLLHEMSRGTSFSAVYFEGNRNEYTDENSVTHGGKLHHKTIIIDDHTVLTGSFNWSESARDSNREVFYLIRSSFAASVFSAEFERQLRLSRRAEWIFRPQTRLLTAEDRDIHYKANSKEICLKEWNNAEAPLSAMVFFSGTGAWSAARVYKISDTSGCTAFNSQHSVSSGIAEGKTYTVPPDAFGSGGLQRYPCTDAYPCRWIRVNYFSGDLGHIETEENKNIYKYLHIWNRKGIEEKIPLTYTGQGFYTFPPLSYSGGDSLLFLEDHQGRISASCSFSAKEPAGPLQSFLLYQHYKGADTGCIFLFSKPE